MAGYMGKNCSINIDDCKDDGTLKCQNNGTCIDQVGRYSCDCPEPYMGMLYTLLALKKFILQPFKKQHMHTSLVVNSSCLDDETTTHNLQIMILFILLSVTYRPPHLQIHLIQ
jgi:hypothetical protein